MPIIFCGDAPLNEVAEAKSKGDEDDFWTYIERRNIERRKRSETYLKPKIYPSTIDYTIPFVGILMLGAYFVRNFH